MEQLKILTAKEQEEVYKAPVLVGLIAALKDGEINTAELKDAVKLTHYRTFTSPLILQNYYKSCDKVFERNLKATMAELSTDSEQARHYLKTHLKSMDSILTKLPEEFRNALKQSLYSFGKHVAKSDKSWLQDLVLFIDPFIPLE